MLENIDKYEKMDRYVRGEMSDSEREVYERELESDKELRARLHIVEDVKDGLQRRAEKLDKISVWERQHAQNKRKSPYKMLIASISVAAAVVAVIMISTPRTAGPVKDEVFQPTIPVIRGNHGVDMHRYWDEGKYEECLTAINDALAATQDELQSLDADSYEDYEYAYLLRQYEYDIDLLLWGRILTLYKLERYDEVLSEVTEYLQRDGYYKEDAEKLYERVNK